VRINAGELALCESSESTGAARPLRARSTVQADKTSQGRKVNAWRDTFRSLVVIIKKLKYISAVLLIQIP